MFYLWDMIEQAFVGKSENLEDTVRMVGAIMSFFGRGQAQNRFAVTREPHSKTGSAQVVYSASDLWQRALVYYDENILKQMYLRSLGLQ